MITHPTYVMDPTARDVAAEAARLRRLGDLVRVELPGGIPAWAPTRHVLLKSLLTDDRVSRDPSQHWTLWREGWIEAHPETHWIFTWVGLRSMITAYGPDHRRLRTLISPAFTARRTAALRPAIERLTAGLLDGLEAAPQDDPVDLRMGFAHPLPMGVICDLLGVPDAHRPALKLFFDTIIDTTVPGEEAGRVLEDLRAALAELVALRRREPGDDMTSALIAARDGGDGLSEAELVDTLLLIVGAGHETTVNLIGNATVALLTHPDQLALVRSGRVPWINVIEETLRWAPSIAHLPLRFAVTDIDIAGVTVRAGEAILGTFGAVGWDPEFHGDRAHLFDVTREPSRHLAFGYGAHHCLGAPLARLEGVIALPALFERFPHLALGEPAESMEPYPSFITNGYRAPLVRLT
ncbi:cytochrome P450 family protein [Streptomyces sp. NBC_01803]|uniref:cytochrome P450 family protein n=1 Tax=Streptomyces sp. NBC_01803 TaxID=2975946 RepID=UPI002DD9198A|nr:cytochrome P450 [Streptomyces sp. NBC_01803]WSA43072.1 cytochrome P450 [Streptomyces sp. NBC_01803]